VKFVSAAVFLLLLGCISTAFAVTVTTNPGPALETFPFPVHQDVLDLEAFQVLHLSAYVYIDDVLERFRVRLPALSA
jgi:hypothetical protein